jgi:hypothetical protein
VASETEQVREFRDGRLDDLSRVHGEINGLLERTRRQRDQALPGGAQAKPLPAPEPEPAKPPGPAKAPELE